MWNHTTMKLARILAINLIRQRGEMSQRDYAKKLGISKSSLSRIENEDQNVTLDMLDQFMAATGWSIEDLLSEKQRKK